MAGAEISQQSNTLEISISTQEIKVSTLSSEFELLRQNI